MLAGLLAFSGCGKAARNDSNGRGESRKEAAWVAQYRPPASMSGAFAGTNLGFFSFNTISVVSKDIAFVGADFPSIGDPNRRYGAVLRTANGGKTWIETPLRTSGFEIDRVNAVRFVNPTLGWAFGSFPSGTDPDSTPTGLSLKTTDGGASWAASKIGAAMIPTCAFFADANNGWMGVITAAAGGNETSGGGEIFATSDGGVTWRSQHGFPTSINDVFFIDKQNGWAGGSSGTIYRTADGGATWTPQKTGLEMGTGPDGGSAQFAVYGIHFIDPQTGWAAARSEDEESGRIVATSNGGLSWTQSMLADQERLRSVFFVSRNEGWAASSSGRYIYHTTDGGRNWTAEQIVFEQNLAVYGIAGSDPSHVWAVGGGAIYVRVSQ